jgi:two-component system response regulator BaeR
MNNPKVMIVEDEKKIAGVLGDYFKKDGYAVFCVHHGNDVLPFLNGEDLDLIVLDLMLPGMDGLSICREIRKFSSIPIIILTARIEKEDVLLGLDLGADDYILKPFSPREVVARARAVLRRTLGEIPAERVTLGPFLLRIPNREFRINGSLVRMTPNEFGIVKVLMSSPGRVFSREELVGLVQGYQIDGYKRTIDTHVKNLRKKISAHLPGRDVIHSVYGSGYRFSLEEN